MVRAKTGGKQRLHEEFLARIYADPENAAPRLVYMDWLLEQQDPRGEFMALQFERDRSATGSLPAKAEREERRLLRLHMESWLGEAASLVVRRATPGSKSPVFSRGFLAQAIVAIRDDAAKRKLAAHPAFSTLVEVNGDVEPFVRPERTALRRTGWGLTFPGFVRLSEERFETRIEATEVSLSGVTPELQVRAAAAKAPVFAHLRTFRCQIGYPESMDWLHRSWVVERVRELDLHLRLEDPARSGRALVKWMEVFLANENLERAHFHGATLLRRGGSNVLSIPVPEHVWSHWLRPFLEQLGGAGEGWELELTAATKDAVNEKRAREIEKSFPAFRRATGSICST